VPDRASPRLPDDQWAALLAAEASPNGRLADPVATASLLLAGLGGELASYVAAVDDPGLVAQWASDKAVPTEQQAVRLTYAALAAKLVADDTGWTTCRSWLTGTAPTLDGEAPASVLRESEDVSAYEDVLAAAKHWVGGGYA
jgi:hypothetical protein